MRSDPTRSNPLAAFDRRQLRETNWQDLLARFVFGAVVSVAAGSLGLTLGAHVGGMLLAFPAILPATLTLIAKHEGEQRSFHDLQGTVAGACGLVGFGVVTAVTFGHLSVLVVLALGLLAWCVVAGGLYLVWATWLRRRGVTL